MRRFFTSTDTEGQKIALFQYIAKNHKSVGITWSSIANALRDIHAGDLSLRIREQYCSHRDGENVVRTSYTVHMFVTYSVLCS